MAVLVFEIDGEQVRRALNESEQELVKDLDRAVDKLLEAVEEEQIVAYGQDSNPSKPGGSTYTRTFTLKDASSKERTGRLSGRWYADEGVADYAEHVIGPRGRQAQVHRGRWKSIEDVQEAVERKAPEIIELEIAK